MRYQEWPKNYQNGNIKEVDMENVPQANGTMKEQTSSAAMK
jgi:hypothetical protein